MRMMRIYAQNFHFLSDHRNVEFDLNDHDCLEKKEGTITYGYRKWGTNKIEKTQKSATKIIP